MKQVIRRNEARGLVKGRSQRVRLARQLSLNFILSKAGGTAIVGFILSTGMAWKTRPTMPRVVADE